MNEYGINDIKSLSFREGVRARVQMYLGSDDIEGTYQAFKEIVNNSTDEAIAGYGNKIEIAVSERNNAIYIRDYGRGVPLGSVKTAKMYWFQFIVNLILVENLKKALIKTRQASMALVENVFV